MTAGIVDHCTGLRDVRKLGGLGRYMPVTAFSAAIGVAALAGLPFTTGFISKELLLADLLDARAWNLVCARCRFRHPDSRLRRATLLQCLYRLQAGSSLRASPWLAIQTPPLLLALAALILGTFPGLLDGTLNAIKVAGLHEDEPIHLALWHGFNLEVLTTALIIVCGWGCIFFVKRAPGSVRKFRASFALIPPLSEAWTACQSLPRSSRSPCAPTGRRRICRS